MSVVNPVSEYQVAVGAISNDHIEALERLGVPAEIASGVLPDLPMVGIARVVTHAEFYEPHESGEPHYLCPCTDGDDITDIVAWRPGNPGKWWTRCGCAVLLNPSEPARVAMAQAWGDDERLLINETTLSWLRARCRGVVVLDWRRCIPFHLSTVREVECETEALAKRLRTAYATSDLPRIFYQEGLSHAA